MEHWSEDRYHSRQRTIYDCFFFSEELCRHVGLSLTWINRELLDKEMSVNMC